MSETEVAIRDQQLEALSGDIKALFDGLERSTQRDQDLAEIAAKLAEFDTPLDTMYLDLKSLDVSVKKRYQQKHRAYKNQRREWEAQLEWQRKGSARDALVDGATPGTPRPHRSVQCFDNVVFHC